MSDVMANLKSLGLLVCLLGLGADAPGRAAEIGVWEPVGPPSGRVDRFTVDPTDADRLYAGQDEELLRSVDGGRSWHATRHVETERFVALEVAPSEPAIAYANGQVWIAYRFVQDIYFGSVDVTAGPPFAIT